MSTDTPIDERTQAVRDLAEKLFTRAWSTNDESDNEQLAVNVLDAAEAFYEVRDWHESPRAKAERQRAKRASAKAARAAWEASHR